MKTATASDDKTASVDETDGTEDEADERAAQSALATPSLIPSTATGGGGGILGAAGGTESDGEHDTNPTDLGAAASAAATVAAVASAAVVMEIVALFRSLAEAYRLLSAYECKEYARVALGWRLCRITF